jgi:hypothetical protein
MYVEGVVEGVIMLPVASLVLSNVVIEYDWEI